MSRHLSIGTIIDKNKISTDKAFIVLFEVDVRDGDNNLVETLRFCKNSENIVYKSNTYIASNFEINFSSDANQEPRMSVVARDETRTLQEKLEYYGGGTGFKVRITVVNSGNLTQPPELQEEFLILTSSASNYVVTLDLGVETAVSLRFPPRNQYKDRCMWKYKGAKCKYTGGLATCDYTLDGANGCKAHNNTVNFGGFPALNSLF